MHRRTRECWRSWSKRRRQCFKERVLVRSSAVEDESDQVRNGTLGLGNIKGFGNLMRASSSVARIWTQSQARVVESEEVETEFMTINTGPFHHMFLLLQGAQNWPYIRSGSRLG